MVIGRNFGVLVFFNFLLAVASAAEPAQVDVALIYEAATMSVMVTCRHNVHGMSVRPSSGRLPSSLWFLD